MNTGHDGAQPASATAQTLAQLAQGTPLAAAVRSAAAALLQAGVPSARRDAELLAAHALGVDTPVLARHLLMGDCATPAGYAELIARRCERVPLQHLTGVAYFRHLELAVGPGVFIPRPETETVVQWAIDRLGELQARGLSAPLVVDLGTGSGAIAASIAYEVPQSRVHAVELSQDALPWALRNTEPHGVVLHHGDLRHALPELNGQVDVLLTNPPYIPANAIPREPEVHLHDPHMALYGGGEDGMEIPDAAIASAARLLKSAGLFIMEHAEVQAAEIAERMQRTGAWESVSGIRDLNGKDRATVAIRR